MCRHAELPDASGGFFVPAPVRHPAWRGGIANRKQRRQGCRIVTPSRDDSAPLALTRDPPRHGESVSAQGCAGRKEGSAPLLPQCADGSRGPDRHWQRRVSACEAERRQTGRGSEQSRRC
ncbi:hypothetical protein SL003B_0896 [Polymorphum gilvum SL003B-26A1]|uniref:Uncharacterized protein n=1 Tax=Polymorphum gilvum (strain LMG 25793 / CGMCC 1.9160 / SL003B-26A1) TaxID=991905 RepID=F2IX34_POLGS|nr:hypothetical protein SL003B_0896 [Polymorphum gilvum SL003B-26A1]